MTLTPRSSTGAPDVVDAIDELRKQLRRADRKQWAILVLVAASLLVAIAGLLVAILAL